MSKTYTQEEVDAITALVRAEREWVDLTDDEIQECEHFCGDAFLFANDVIAAFKAKQEKNK